MLRLVVCSALLVGSCVVVTAPSRAQAPSEPPPESPEGADYVAEPADTLTDETVEVAMGAAGRAGGSPRRTRRVRFRGRGFSGAVRDGRGDPLSGGLVEAALGGGTLLAGRLAPRWGRGLVLGSPGEPWDGRALDRGRAPFRGRAGEGLCFRRPGIAQVEIVAGRFGRSHLGGLALSRQWLGLGVLGDGRGRVQTTLAAAGGRIEAEMAADERGKWRFDALRTVPLGERLLTAHLRTGAAAFHSLAEPLRSGPAQAMTLSLGGTQPSRGWMLLGSLWRFRPGVTGARGAAWVSLAVRARSRITLGFEEQHGVRRETRAYRAHGPRQGGWAEWRGGDERMTLALRQELWGSRALADAVRRVSGARFEMRGPGGIRFRVAHTAYRTSFGESLYLREVYSDRLVLRALSGHGVRTRVEVRVPAAGGLLTASISTSRTSSRVRPATWTIDWSRRTRGK